MLTSEFMLSEFIVMVFANVDNFRNRFDTAVIFTMLSTAVEHEQ